MPDVGQRIAENVARVRQYIDAAARRSGRTPGAVQLVAVTKYVGAQEVRALVAAGCRDIGESRPQELWRKAEALAGAPIRWHLVGHLQRNKVRRTLPLLTLLHSADSQRLLGAVNQSAEQSGRAAPVLLEVNISGDEAKHGFAPDALERLLPELATLEHVRIRGLMTMASLAGGPGRARRDFAELRQLRDRLAAHCPPEVGLEELSMGMSGDYEIAIEEGATIVRVGSALFEGLLPGA